MTCNEFCKQCPLSQTKNPHFDYLTKTEKCDILFVADYFKGYYFSPFSKDDMAIIINAFSGIKDVDKLKIKFTAALKCPNLKDKEITTKVKTACRNHLDETIKVSEPTLIFACGNIAFNMLTKKSGITKYRGEIFPHHLGPKVCAIFHPYAVIREPKHEVLFNIDITNAVNRIFNNFTPEQEVEYEAIFSLEALEKYRKVLTVNSPLAMDLETTGFDFLQSEILSISTSYYEEDGEIKTFVIPIQHKAFVWSEEEYKEVLKFIGDILSSQQRKVFHNAKFDLKMLMNYGFKDIKNVECTKNLAKYMNENRPIRLRDLVKEYFGVVIC